MLQLTETIAQNRLSAVPPHHRDVKYLGLNMRFIGHKSPWAFPGPFSMMLCQKCDKYQGTKGGGCWQDGHGRDPQSCHLELLLCQVLKAPTITCESSPQLPHDHWLHPDLAPGISPTAALQSDSWKSST